MPDRLKTLRHLYLAEHIGSPVQIECDCGETHAVLTKDFDVHGPEVKPKQLVRLNCVHHFEKLEEILEAESNINIEAEFRNPVQKALGSLLIKFYTWKFIRETNA